LHQEPFRRKLPDKVRGHQRYGHQPLTGGTAPIGSVSLAGFNLVTAASTQAGQTLKVDMSGTADRRLSSVCPVQVTSLPRKRKEKTHKRKLPEWKAGGLLLALIGTLEADYSLELAYIHLH
jgi:hypothetical protein